MNPILHSMKTHLLLTGAAAAALTLAATSHAGLQIPYTPDAAALHLWHLDGANSLTTPDAVTTSPITLTNLGLPVGSFPYTNSTLGNASFSGLGECKSTTTKVNLLYGGAFTDVAEFCNPESGAFTFEAVVKFNINPLGSMDAQLVCGDQPGGLGVRGWQWRIFNGKMQWNLLANSAADNFFETPLPSVGANAAIAGTWYHVAVTYTGYNPTNGDTANVLEFYWTLLDANRIAADPLPGGQFTATRRLDGSYVDGTPFGTTQPYLGVGGSARNITTNPGNNEGIIGSIDEVRISSVARRSNEMAFVSGGAGNPPSVTQQPPVQTLVGYGKTLTISALISGTPPLYYQWQHEGANVPGQTDTTLILPNVTFEDAGNYQLVVTNSYGQTNTAVAQVTIGAIANELFHTGLDTNGTLNAGNIPDPHWILHRSADAAYLGPNAMIFEVNNPLEKLGGAFSPTNGVSMWISPVGNLGGITANSPAGLYTYRTTFLLDSADPATVRLSGNVWVNGSISDVLINGKSLGMAIAPGGTLYVATFAVTNGFVPGLNTLDFVANQGAVVGGLRVEIGGVGQALPPGPPVITADPLNQVVRDANTGTGSRAEFSVVALGRPPLSYQWLSSGVLISGATGRTLTFSDPTAGAQGTSFSVVVNNDSGSATSKVATLALVSANQPPVPAVLSAVSFQGTSFSYPLSQLVQDAKDPDHDPITYVMADTQSTNVVQYGTNNVEQVGATLVYYPVEGYVGADAFTYTISDPVEQKVATVHVLSLASPAGKVVPVGGSATFSAGVTSVPAGYSFQWQLNGTNIAGATTAQWTVNNAQLANAGAYRLAVTNAIGQGFFSPTAGLTVGTLGSGTGITGDYYGYANGTTNYAGAPTLTRLDATVNFNWGTDVPDAAIPADYFLVRWHGQVQPIYSDTYTFSTTTDDGARLWVDGKLLVNQWQNQGATTVSGTIDLQAGQKYDLVMEYYENTSTASAQLSWSSVHQAAEIIPATQLYPGTTPLQPKLAGEKSGTNLVLDWPGTFSLQAAPSVTGPWTSITAQRISPFTTNLNAAPQLFFRLNAP